jgi:uncharacterized protein YceH (UPF0502 family)
MGMAMNWLSNLRDLFRTIDGLMLVERTHGAAIADLKERVVQLEAREAVLVAEAKAAASAAASAVSAQHVADLARRLGVLEEQVRQLRGSRRLLPER